MVHYTVAQIIAQELYYRDFKFLERNKNFSTVTANPLVWQNYHIKLQQKVTAASQYPHNLYICEISSNFPINVMAAVCLNA